MSLIGSPALKTLQTSPNGVHIVGKSRTKTKVVKGKLSNFFPKSEKSNDSEPKKTVKHIGVSTNVATENRCVGTDFDSSSDRETVVKMLTTDEPSFEYWKLLAEERRVALDEVMKENLEFCQEMARLKEENRRLKRLADEGRELARILQLTLDEDKTEPVSDENQPE